MIFLFIYVLLLHWLGDFILQTRYIADNKSKNWEVLVLHVFIYSCILFTGMLCTAQYTINDLCRFTIINFIAHLGVDAITSRCTKLVIENKNVHLFFVIVGFDQFLHTITLLLTYCYLLGKPMST